MTDMDMPPLHPIHYTPMRERLHNECDSIEAARATESAHGIGAKGN